MKETVERQVSFEQKLVPMVLYENHGKVPAGWVVPTATPGHSEPGVTFALHTGDRHQAVRFCSVPLALIDREDLIRL